MTFEKAFALFAETVFPGGVPAPSIEPLRALGRLVAIERHTAADLAADRTSCVFLASGATKLVAQGSSSGGQILSFQMPGDFVCVPGAAPHKYNLVAVRPATALTFAKGELMELAGRHPDMLKMLAKQVFTALQECQEQLVTVGRRSATERVAGFIVALARTPQAASDNGHALSLVMNRREIAECLGLTVETVSRQFSLLRQRKLIETPSRSTVCVPDRVRLARCAGHIA